MSGPVALNESVKKRKKKSVEKKQSTATSPQAKSPVLDVSEKKSKDDLKMGRATEGGVAYNVSKEVYNSLDSSLFTIETVQLPIDPGKKVFIKTTKELVVTHCAPEFEEIIDLGDVIISINGKAIKTKDDLRDEIRSARRKPGPIAMVRKRLAKFVKLDKTSPDIPAAEERPDGLEYYKAHLVLGPNASLGMVVKGTSGKLYISSVDNGWRSISRRTFQVGDAILAISDNNKNLIGVACINDFKRYLTASLMKQNYCQIIFERATGGNCVKQVRQALAIQKSLDIDPRMADDVNDICEKELKALDALEKNPPVLTGLLTKPNPPRKDRISIKPISREICIGVEPNVNPGYLSNPPLRGKKAAAATSETGAEQTASDSSSKSKPKKSEGSTDNPIMKKISDLWPFNLQNNQDKKKENTPDLATKKDNPDISTKKGNPDISTKKGNPETSTKKGNPDISTKKGNPETSTKKGNPDISTKKGNPDISTKKGNPDVSKKNKNSKEESSKKDSRPNPDASSKNADALKKIVEKKAAPPKPISDCEVEQIKRGRSKYIDLALNMKYQDNKGVKVVDKKEGQ